MWAATTAIIDRFGLPEARKSLVNKIRSQFNVPSKGVVFVFERGDYRNFPNATWRPTAVHLNIQVGGMEEISPEHILGLMKSKEYSNLIWLSKQACEDRDIWFSWILAHELRHLEQDLQSHTLSRAGHFLNRALARINIEEPKIQNTIPTELDANLKAWRVVRKVFGAEVADAHVKNESTTGQDKQSFRILMSHGSEKAYDVLSCTISLLRKYQSPLEELQKESKDHFVATFDIGAVCAELDRVRNNR